MDGSTLTSAEWVALVGSGVAFFAVLLGNLDKIIEFFSKYMPKLAKRREQKKQDEMEKNLNIVVPKILAKHTASQKGNCQKEIIESVKEEVHGENLAFMNIISTSLDEINKKIDKIDTRLDAVEEGSKDQLRQRINEIFYDAVKTMTITTTKRTELDTLYRDYKKLYGNSYIDDRYKLIVEECEVIPD